MKEWTNPVIEELDITMTANMGNNDTHEHLGWCAMHKHPEKGVCTCGAGNNNSFVDSLS